MRRLKTLDRCKVATSICDPVSTGHDFPSFPISLSLGECACADWEIALDTVFQRIFQQSAMQSLVQASTLGKLALLGLLALGPAFGLAFNRLEFSVSGTNFPSRGLYPPT